MKIINSTFFLLLLMPLFSFSAEDEKSELFFSLENYTYSDPTSIDSFIHEFDGGLETGDYAFINNLVQAGIKYHNWSASIIHRYDHFYEFSPDTARFYYLTENSLLQNDGQNYQIGLAGNHINSRGLKLDYHWEVLPSFNVTLSASYLDASEHYDVNIHGAITSQVNNSISGQLSIATQSHRDLVLQYPVSDVDGSGYAIDLGFNWAINEKLSLGLLVRDAFSEIDWENSLDTDLFVSTAQRNVDANGNISISPLLSGTQRLSSAQQELPTKIFTHLKYKLSDKHQIGADTFFTSYFTHTNLEYTYLLSDQSSVFFQAGLNTNGLGLGYQNRFGRFGLLMDSTSYEDAKAISLIFDLNISL